MPAAVNQASNQRLYRAIGGCVLLAGLLGYSPAHAGGMYRCTGSNGEAVFSSNTSSYKDCHKLSAPAEVAPPRQPRAVVAAIASVLGVHGSVESTAQLLPPELSAAQALSAVTGSVETTARLLAPAAVDPSVKPGQWSYSESKKALEDGSATADAAPSPGDRVLRGAVYRVVRADGSVEYTNLQPAGQPARAVTMLFSYISTCMACNLHSPIHWNSVALNLTAYADTIRVASVQFGVDEAFLRAIIHAESAFNPRALSIKGAQGLMQLMPATAGDMGVRDAFDADQNILGGARYLALLLKNFNGDERLAAAAYNAGANAVLRYNGVPPYAETQVYVERVGELRKRYGAVTKPPVATAAVLLPGKSG
ncbi:lytic transglycosylase domain-containing protein [Dyella silvatica]|uniref:lytic transglycosylase domain-containing protein n=1 Tax=Dyella silvatica TaxID=2992128 RepID=UPI00225558A3|nr:lytic transglycosylase domain-containing protein [Dyella silvatica]